MSATGLLQKLTKMFILHNNDCEFGPFFCLRLIHEPNLIFVHVFGIHKYWADILDELAYELFVNSSL